jgi:hypothetical protein
MQVPPLLTRIALLPGAAFLCRSCVGVLALPVRELGVGPLSAGMFPKLDFDTSLGTERLFYFAGRQGAGAIALACRGEDPEPEPELAAGPRCRYLLQFQRGGVHDLM